MSLKTASIFVAVATTYLVADSNITELLLNPPPPKTENQRFNTRIEQESAKDLNGRYRDCMNKYRDRAKCENEKMEPNNKFIIEYK